METEPCNYVKGFFFFYFFYLTKNFILQEVGSSCLLVWENFFSS